LQQSLAKERRITTMIRLEGLQWQKQFNEHMGCIKGCLDYLGIERSFPWLYGGTGHAFVLNVNETVFVDCALAWNALPLFDLAPNLGFTVERLAVEHPVAREMPDAEFLQKQLEAWDFVRARMDQGLPCYGWELAHIPAYYVINGYDEVGYYYSGWESGGPCPWQKLGTFDVKQIAVHCVRPTEPATDIKVVKDALTMVLARVERPDGWAVGPQYRTGLAGYDLWAEALETGRANRDGEAYINQVWLECREMAVAFLEEAKTRLPGTCAAAFDQAIGHYTTVRDRLGALAELHPERPEAWDWQTPLVSPEGAQLVREAGEAERKGVACLRQIVDVQCRYSSAN
jgi:hypothetical protein